MELGRIQRLDLRTVWSHEAHSLTPWLLSNADVLADVLGIDLELTAAEHGVGPFSLDLIGRDLTNDCVLIVENQLTPTDHDHLGKLITYTAGTDAQTVIWLAPSFREEHREALDLLNNLGGERVRFFGVELSAVRIGDSAPAPLLELRVQPNDWHAQLSAVARGVSQGSGKPALYLEFWSRFLERVKEEHPSWTRAKKPGPANWFAMACPFKGGPYYAFSFAQGGKLRSELYIDYTDGDAVATLYSGLSARRERIEAIYGAPLSWEELPDRRASRVADYEEGDVANTDLHDRYIDWFFDSGHRLRQAIDGVVSELVRGPG
ncbi:MAG: DUF4268 domain-containing protein [Actinomycetota bacterium]|nr:DUF4268 domain-containing protein [Actinomycetota bacterium]